MQRIVVERIPAVFEINNRQPSLFTHGAHKYTLRSPPHTPHTKQNSLHLQLGVTWIALLSSLPPQPWECVCSGGKRG